MVEEPVPVEGSFVDESLRDSHSDRLFQVRLRDGRTAFVYTLIEHKSWVDPGLPLQLMGYRHRIWTRHAQGHPDRLRHLPPIITLVVYHGARAWDVPTTLTECIDADEGLLALQRDGRYEVKDLTAARPDYAALSTHPLLRAGLAALAWAYVEGLKPEALAQLLRDLPDDHPLTLQILRYIVRVHTMTEDDFKQGMALAKPHLTEAMTMSLAQEWMERGEAKGVEKGIQQGIQQGVQQGVQQGEAQTLLRQIERKFGPEARARYQPRVEGAAPAELDQWIDRILSAERVEQVFDGDESLQ
jgi:hypothetical protein